MLCLKNKHSRKGIDMANTYGAWTNEATFHVGYVITNTDQFLDMVKSSLQISGWISVPYLKIIYNLFFLDEDKIVDIAVVNWGELQREFATYKRKSNHA
jgi:hypothetical protein